MQVCFNCGAANSPEAKTCHSCDFTLKPDEDDEAADASSEHLEAPTECHNCGHPVEPGDERCGNCGAVLISKDPLDRPCPKSHDHDITSRYDEFATRVQMIRDGRMTRAEFSNWLETTVTKLLSQRERYVEMIQVSGYFEFGQDEVEMAMTGILDYEEGMQMMALYAREEAEMDVLDAALQRMWEGNEKCNEAMRINREFRAKLEDDWGYM